MRLLTHESRIGVVRVVVAACVATVLLPAPDGAAQTVPGAAPPAPAPPAAVAQAPLDSLGRSTPRGTAQGFLTAGRRGDNAAASQYLNTRLTGENAEALAHKLFVVLDTRLPPRLGQVSDQPDSLPAGVQARGREIIGVVGSEEGDVEIAVEQVSRREVGTVWLFSADTLAAIPAVYDEIVLERSTRFLPRALTTARIGGIRLVEWLAVVLGLAILYLVTVLLNKVLTPLVARLWRRTFEGTHFASSGIVPAPARLLVLSLLSQWLLARLPFSLLMRQFWSSTAVLLTIVSTAWLLVLLMGEVERYIRHRMAGAPGGAAHSLLRLGRRAVEFLVILAALLATLRHFGIDPTPALAGLGVGGIAVALAAQKTLENVIAGASLIFDQAVRVGDFLKMGDTVGTVDHIGLRSTRIRTLDRTVVSVPNSQIANASLETLSARDKYWFHPIVGLSYETTSEQLHNVVDDLRRLLSEHRSVDRESVRVRFHNLGAFSLDVEVSAYITAQDWLEFTAIQEQLLFSVTEIVERAGTAIAFPSQTMYIKGTPSDQVAPAMPGDSRTMGRDVAQR